MKLEEIAPAPLYTDHPLLLQAWAEANSMRYAWRRMYDMPPNDPRYLSMTDREMMHDLLVAVYRHSLAAPGTVQDAANDRDGSYMEDLGERGHAFVDDEGTQRALRALLGGGTKKAGAADDVPMRVTLRGRVDG